MWTTLLSVVLVINELMASNVGDVISPAINYDSWIEIYNPNNEDVNLAGMYLSNDEKILTKWQMPESIGTVPAKGFKVVWLGSNDIILGYNEEEVGKNQAPFKLDCDGGTIYLSDVSGKLITSQTYPEAISHTAWARKADGGNEWGWTATATPGESNATATFATERLAAPVVSVGSKLFTGSLTINVTIPEGTRLMYTTDGSLPAAPKPETGEEEKSPWTQWIKNGDCEGTDASCFVCRDGNSEKDENRITDGVGVDGSRGVTVHAIDNAPNEWTTQFFVYTPDHIWKTGEHYRFHMKVRADKPSPISVQAHRTPGDYITMNMLDGNYNVTTEWTEISYEGTVTSNQAGEQRSWGGGGWGGGWGGGGGGWGGWGDDSQAEVTYSLQTIAFNLNANGKNNFYFDEISWESMDDGAEEESTKESKDGKFTISNTTNYTFRLYQDGYLPSVPVTRSYIMNSSNYTLPVISIVGDKRFFTDPKIGIDCEGDGTNGKTGNGQNSPRNYNQDWDRPVNFSFISPEGEMLFNQDVNISVSGGWTRSQQNRSFKLKSNKIFDGLNHLDYPFFPQKPFIRNKALLVRNGGNDVWSHSARFTDPALETIIQRSGIDVDVQSYVPIIEYVNGKLHGLLNLRETNNDKFAYANWGYDDEELDAFENLKMKNGDDVVINRIFELGRQINEAGAYDELKTMLDIDEFTNYMAVTMFLDNDDWPNNNIKAYRSRNDGRYRFISFDLDYAFAGRNFNKDNDDPFTYFYRFKDAEKVYDEGNQNREIVRLFLNLLSHKEFRRKFIDTFCLVAGSVFEPTRAGEIVDELLAVVQPMADLMNQQGARDGNNPGNAADNIKYKLSGRSDNMTNYMQKFSLMDLANTRRQAVALETDTEGANLYINGMEVPYATFDGHLFAPIELEAKAPAGYSFAGWKKSFGASNQVVKTNDTWKYYDQGQQSGNSWRTSNFDDSSWASGEAPLGYSMTGVKTTISYGGDAQKKNPTTYFRKSITFNNTPTAKDVFQLNYQVDDGCVIYVNGKEAARVNMPDGTISYTTFSSSYASDTPLTGTVELKPTLFKQGNNVIAVEVHNNSDTSSDLFWTCELLTSVDAGSDEYISTDAVFNLPNDSKIALVACFTKMSDEERKAQGLTPVCINEVSADNGIYVNEYWKRNDWVELYNTTDADIDVAGMYLTDNLSKPKKYQISGEGGISTIIPAHGYLIIWCDKLDPLTQLHASFKLAAEGGEVMLTAADESWNNQLTYGEMKEDQTVGRYPDGAANVITMNIPTIAKTNITSSYATVVKQGNEAGIHDIMVDATEDLSIRYVLGALAIRSSLPADLQVKIANLAGQSIATLPARMSGGYGEVSVEQLPAGVYIATITDEKGHQATCKFIKR